MTKKLPLVILLFLFSFFGSAQETFKVMFYNLLNYPLQQPASRIQDLEVILTDYQPDIFMVCELNNITGANNILNTLNNINTNYSRATFVSNTSDDTIGNQNDLQNMIYYDSSKFTLQSQNVIPTLYRDFNHYELKLNTVNQVTNPITIHAFVCHLKSSSGTTNQNLRKQMVDDFVAYLATMPNDSYILLGGDLNVYTNSEPAFQELIDTSNNITLIDPANRMGSWHNNINYLDVFTQSTRTQTGLGGATGGFDDRFDFIMTSENMQSNSEIEYVTNSYQVYGNNDNNNCWNSEINSNDCVGSTYNFTIRDALYNMSDHLPVTLELQTNEALLSNDYFVITEPVIFNNGNIISNVLELKLNDLSLRENTFSIYNNFGQAINTFQFLESNYKSFDCENYSSGIYYILSDSNNMKPLKFIVRL